MKLPNNLLRRLGLGALAVLLLAALVFVFLRSGPLAPTRVTVAQAATGSVTPALFGIGTVEARRAYLIGPTVAGRVRAVAVDVGQAVRAGQLLAEMDPVDLAERAAALDASLARAGSAVAAAQAQQRDARARQELAAQNLRRNLELADQSFISSGALDARRQEQLSADAAAQAAEANLAAARQEQLSADAAAQAAEANLAAARQEQQRLQAERAALQRQRANLRLLAPAAGVVTSREAEPGSTVVAGQAVLRLIEPDSLWVRVRLDQGRSAGLAPGLSARIVLRSNPGQALAGRVARVEALSDSVTEERVAQVAFDAIPAGLSVGELAEVTLQLAPTAPGVLVPNASIRRHAGQTGVWRVADGTPQFVPVRTGAASLDGQVQVLEGLAAGTPVVVYSEKELRADSRIRVVPALAGARP